MVPSPPSPARLPGVRAVVFDFDGTLFDSFDSIVHSFNTALRKGGHAELSRERIGAFVGRPLVEMARLILPEAPPAEIDRMVADYREAFRPVCLTLSRLLPGVVETLDLLRARGLRLGILTNRMGSGARLMLDGFGLSDRFEATLCLGDIEHPKPDPRGLQEILRRFALPPGAALMVGDAPVDIETGRNAGVRTAGIVTGFHPREDLLRAGADAVMDRMDELPGLLGL